MQVSLEQPDSCRRQMQHAHIAREFGLGGPASPKVQAPDDIARVCQYSMMQRFHSMKSFRKLRKTLDSRPNSGGAAGPTGAAAAAPGQAPGSSNRPGSGGSVQRSRPGSGSVGGGAGVEGPRSRLFRASDDSLCSSEADEKLQQLEEEAAAGAGERAALGRTGSSKGASVSARERPVPAGMEARPRSGYPERPVSASRLQKRAMKIWDVPEDEQQALEQAAAEAAADAEAFAAFVADDDGSSSESGSSSVGDNTSSSGDSELELELPESLVAPELARKATKARKGAAAPGSMAR
jgi:hypothetical protein